MVSVLDALILGVVSLMALVLLRWFWLSRERRKLGRKPSLHEAERFDPDFEGDEKDRTYSGRIIRRLRSSMAPGRVEIHWELHPEFIHRGFVLTGKSRRDEGEWQPLPIEPWEDNGSLTEGFKYGETRSYLFTIKKKYWFFFGLFGEEPTEIVYDQISFAVRSGRYHKEMTEHMRDRTEFLKQVADYGNAEREVRKVMRERHLTDTRVEKLEQRRRAKSELADYLEQRTAEINANTSWSDERKRKEIERVERMVEEMELGE